MWFWVHDDRSVFLEDVISMKFLRLQSISFLWYYLEPCHGVRYILSLSGRCPTLAGMHLELKGNWILELQLCWAAFERFYNGLSNVGTSWSVQIRGATSFLGFVSWDTRLCRGEFTVVHLGQYTSIPVIPVICILFIPYEVECSSLTIIVYQ